MENRGLLAIIAVLLLGIFTVMVIELNEQTPEEQMAESVSHAVNSVSNKMTENLRAE